MKIAPKYGANLRLRAYDTPREQWLLMQNVDMRDDENYYQIDGSVKYHGTALGTNYPTCIMPFYPTKFTAHVLSAIDDKIVRKIHGQNEFETLFSGLTPNKIKSYVNVGGKQLIAHPAGLLSYDGVTVELINGGPKLSEIIFSRETNRAFAVSAEQDNALLFTDDVSETGGVPSIWNPINAQALPQLRGDSIEKLDFINGRLVVAMTNAIYIQYVTGSPANWRFQESETVVGVRAPQTWKKVGGERWYLGFSPETGVGVYAFNGATSRLLSHDFTPFLKRINKDRIQNAVAELVNNIYKISIPIDGSLVNNFTLHFDTINQNALIESPNIYGPHTYGFQSSAVLDTRIFDGEHIFGRQADDGGRIYKVADYRTQYSNELNDDGELIPCVLLSGIMDKEPYGKAELDSTWFKKYHNLFVEHPPEGTWYGFIDILKGYENEVYTSYQEFFEGQNTSIEALILGSDALNYKELEVSAHPMEFDSDSIQLRASNYNVNTKFAFRAMSYDVKPERRRKNVQIVSIP